MVIVETRNLKKIYNLGINKVYALNGVDLSIEEGTFVSIIGASGSGKTSLLNLIGALDTPTEGKIFIRGFNLSELSQNEQTIFRRRNFPPRKAGPTPSGRRFWEFRCPSCTRSNEKHDWY